MPVYQLLRRVLEYIQHPHLIEVDKLAANRRGRAANAVDEAAALLGTEPELVVFQAPAPVGVREAVARRKVVCACN